MVIEFCTAASKSTLLARNSVTNSGDESEVSEIIQHGSINYNKIEEDARGKTYPIEGITHDKQHVRIVIAPKNDESLSELIT